MQAFLPLWFNRFTAKINSGNTYTLGGMSDSYYEYLLKVWLLKGKQVCPCLSGRALVQSYSPGAVPASASPVWAAIVLAQTQRF